MFQYPLMRAEQIRSQQQRQRGWKLYSFHAPEVECIGKGKAEVPYELMAGGTIVLRQKKSRLQLLRSLANVASCLIGMEACAGAHCTCPSMVQKRLLSHAPARCVVSPGCDERAMQQAPHCASERSPGAQRAHWQITRPRRG